VLLNISSISVETIQKGELEKEIPEFYELKNVVENNAWHENDSVFDHTLSVVGSLLTVIQDSGEKVISVLNQKVDRNTRHDLLFLATLFHDIGKKETIIKNNGITSCPDHESKGAEKTKPILERFDLSQKEKNWIFTLIKHHGEINFVLNEKDGTLAQRYAAVQNDFSDIALELILFSIADVQGSQVNKKNPAEGEYRVNFLKTVLKAYF
jgi:UTP:GlnB (protein PII) uridylyltransferase